MNNLTNSVLMFSAGVLVGGLAIALWLSVLSPVTIRSEMGNTATSSMDAVPLPPDTSGSVSVSDQLAGDSVLVESVTVPPPGVWVAVREVNGALLGNILGAAHARGPVVNLVVSLLRTTMPGGSYAVQLYRDNGDDQFDVVHDSIYVDFDTGAPVIAPFATIP